MYRLLKYYEKIDDVNDRLKKYGKSLKKFMDENENLIVAIVSGVEVSVPVFLELYDKRIYDIHSRQEDIKYMKELDFEGLYLLKNETKKKYYLGKAEKVFRKVERHFNGYGNKEIYIDFQNNNKFTITFMYYKSDEYADINIFENEMKKQFKAELFEYIYYGTKIVVDNNKVQDKPNKLDMKKLEVSIFSELLKLVRIFICVVLMFGILWGVLFLLYSFTV